MRSFRLHVEKNFRLYWGSDGIQEEFCVGVIENGQFVPQSGPSFLRCLRRTDDYVERLQATSRRAQMDSGGNWLASMIHYKDDEITRS